MATPTSCPGDQPPMLKVVRGGNTWYAGGGGDTCAWSVAGILDLILVPGVYWRLTFTSWSPGGAGEETLKNESPVGTYSSGSVVSVYEP